MNRIVPGILLAVFWLLLLLKGSAVLFSVVALVIAFVAADEYLRMATSEVLRRRERIFLNTVTILPVLSVTVTQGSVWVTPSLITAFFALTGYFFYRYAKFKESYAFFSRLVFGLIYVGLLFSYIPLSRFLENGAEWLLIATAVTAFSDSGAYFVGCSIGKHKLCPRISPKKTIEGALGGLFFAIIGAFASAYILLPGVSPVKLGLGAVILTIAGVAGDLTESIIKRGTGVKDSGTWLRGHGGILDRIDSMLFAIPLLYFMLTLCA